MFSAQAFLLYLLVVVLVQQLSATASATRRGRCPHPQYAFSGLNCSSEGNDTMCPSNYKCCPLTDGMKCFAPCPRWKKPCKKKCKFGLKVDPSPCTTCKCAEDPCLSQTCPQGAICVVRRYQPCAIAGRCGLTTRCIRDPSATPGPSIKPNNCPDYWPATGGDTGNYLVCNASDGECPGAQKCCVKPPPFVEEDPALIQHVCVDPCVSIDSCNLSCPFGLVVNVGCRVCQCKPDPCEGYTCPPGQRCEALPPPCAYYNGAPPCSLLPVCLESPKPTI